MASKRRLPPGDAKEGTHVARIWNRLLEQLLLVRLGQELGTSSELAQAIAHSIDAAVAILHRLTN